MKLYNGYKMKNVAAPKNTQKCRRSGCSASKVAPPDQHHYSGDNLLLVINSNQRLRQPTQCSAFYSAMHWRHCNVFWRLRMHRTNRACRDETIMRKCESMFSYCITVSSLHIQNKQAT